jgi:hypothetical protein
MRVGALPIVEHFHVVEDRPNRFLASLKLVSMNELAFQCRKEALDDRVDAPMCCQATFCIFADMARVPVRERSNLKTSLAI